jgi:ABC-type antimicrobial peptide transport system permease subunit
MGGTFVMVPARIDGQTEQWNAANVTTRGAVVSPDYFRTMGISIRSGRFFAANDTAASEPAAIVNQAFVRRLLPDGPPVGNRVRIGTALLTVVGVIGDERYFGPAQEPVPEVYIPYSLSPNLQFVSMHTAVADESALAAAREVIRRLDPELSISQVTTLRQSVDNSIALQREMMTLLGGCAAVTLCIATVGLYGLMVYVVSKKRREIGLRVALGAGRGDITRSVFGNALRLAVAGATAGVALALISARLLESLLYGVRSYDPVVLMFGPLTLGVVVLVACALPAWRASGIEPMTAFRQD